MTQTGRPIAQLDPGELYTRYGGVVLRRIRRFYSQEEAVDVLQEVFVRAIEKAPSFRGDSAPSTWLYQLTTRYCLNRLRNEGRRRELWLDQGALFWSQPVSRPEQEGRALLRELWRSLDEELVMIGILYFVDGMSHAQIARQVGCSRRTVGNRLDELQSRARTLAGEADS